MLTFVIESIMNFFIILFMQIVQIFSVDKGNFKTCEQSSFCKRNRRIQPGVSPFAILSDTVQFNDGSIIARVLNSNTNITFLLTIDTLYESTARVRVNEIDPIRFRHIVFETLIKEPSRFKYSLLNKNNDGFKLKFEKNVIVVTYKPMKIDFYDDADVLLVSFNNRGLMNFEHYRVKPGTVSEASKSNESNDLNDQEEGVEKEESEPEHVKDVKIEDGEWEESFKEHRDSKPYGPSSIGMDVSFVGFEHVYGIPEHADSLALKNTSPGDPYRLYNLDVFEYDLYNPMALYGSIPYMVAHNTHRTVGLFFNNAAEMWIDIKSSKSMLGSIISLFNSGDIPTTETHWFAESGIIDMFVMLGPNPHDVSMQYSTLTGTPTLPPMFALGYHQCRWNYNDEEDVKNVDAKFDEHDIPYDVIWLDIEHTDNKKYMTWDALKFPNSKAMIDSIASKGRKMVTIIDPHMKRDSSYHVHNEATVKQFYVKKNDGSDYDGWCWSGSSSWIDYLNPEARRWWASLFQLDVYQGSTFNLFTWNDMNEPSVFNGPEITMHKDLVHYGNWEHRDVHNLYGMLFHMSSFEGHLVRSSGKERPFILSRAFFAGSQRYGAVWTGDNAAQWSHLKASIPMLLSMNVAGLPFVGADIGGFFGNPDGELCVRWWQAAAFTPFFRGHAHIDTRRREPWLFGEENTKLIRAAIRKRYRILPYIYTVMHESYVSGKAVMRPLWMEFPKDPKTFKLDDQYLFGKDLLVKPVTSSGEDEIIVYFPGGENQIWYDFDTFEPYNGGNNEHILTPMTKVPVFIRGGSIIPLKERVRRASSLMINDPLTLIIALNEKGDAEGEIYLDDGHSLDYKDGKYLLSEISMSSGGIMKWDKKNNYSTKSWVERIIVLGMKKKPAYCTSMLDNDIKSLTFTYDEIKNVLVIKKPSPYLDKNFSVMIGY
ncbi:neutral alpha-glucosidase AB isoform X2 [Hydra vulgaris]|uniref:Glucosidase II subunit alpha n=1 Tax=Hydra vulgaris TaxID=6087 RepID=A0ABM4CK88_HYDVU